MTEVVSMPAVAAAAVAVAGACFLFMKRGKKADAEAAVSETGIPLGLEEDYRHGVDPCASGRPVMYTLHTCRHCVHLKDFMDAHGIEHYLVYVDDFQDPARREVMATLRSFNQRGSFPTLVLPDGRCIVGFREAKAKEVFGIE